MWLKLPPAAQWAQPESKYPLSRFTHALANETRATLTLNGSSPSSAPLPASRPGPASRSLLNYAEVHFFSFLFASFQRMLEVEPRACHMRCVTHKLRPAFWVLFLLFLHPFWKSLWCVGLLFHNSQTPSLFVCFLKIMNRFPQAPPQKIQKSPFLFFFFFSSLIKMPCPSNPVGTHRPPPTHTL